MNKSESHKTTQQVGASSFDRVGLANEHQPFNGGASFGSFQYSSDFVPGNRSDVLNYSGFQNPYMPMVLLYFHLILTYLAL